MINEYFKYSEFDCKCGKCERPQGVPSKELVDILTKIRKHYNQPVIINSGYRCEAHNKAVGGSSNSQHFKGSAVDIIVKNTPTESLWEYVLKNWGDDDLGLAIKRNKGNIYAGFVHIDTRGKKARWEYK